MKNQYFMYGILVPYKTYLDLKISHTIDDVLKGDDDIQGIFTGRDNDFMIIGRVLETIDSEDGDAHVVPELETSEESLIRVTIQEKFDISGEYHYYFVTKVK